MAATLAIVGAQVRTMDPDRPYASAVAIDGDTVVAVGDASDIRDVIDAATEVIDVSSLPGGGHVTLGLTDGHVHLLFGAESLATVSFDRVPDLDAVRARIAEAVAGLAPGEWLRGFALEYEALGGRPFHHGLFDDLTGDHPLFIFTLDLHTAFVNARALQVAGITGARDFPDGSAIVVDADGAPTGELRERSAMSLVEDLIPEPSAAQARALQLDAMARLNALGITAVHQMDADHDSLDTFAALADDGVLTLSVTAHSVIAPGADAAYVDELLGRPARRGPGWRADGIKFLLDGVVETGTAWLEAPDDRGGGTEAFWPSLSAWEATVRRCHDAGRQIATHAIGDRAIRTALEVYGRLPAGGRRRIEHIETAPDATLHRFVTDGVTASMQPIHLRWIKADRSDPWSARLTHEQCRHAMRSGDLAAAGVPVVLGSDWPVAPYDPRAGMYAARVRHAPDVPDAEPVGASVALTGAQTLAGYTVNAARAVGEDDRAGMLRPGMRADLAVWGADLVTCDPADLPDLPVHLTVQAGAVVHRAT